MRRLYQFLIAWVLLALSACGGLAAQQPAASNPSPGPAPTTLFLWHGWGGEQAQALARIVDAYNRSQNGVRVVPQRVAVAGMADDIRSAGVAGGGPHLMLFPNRWLGPLTSEGLLLALDEPFPAREQEALIATAVAGARVVGPDGIGQLYGIPVSVDTVALYYNRDNFSEPPPDTVTMLGTARALSAPQATPPRWGLACNLSLDTTVGYLYAFGGRVFDENGELVIETSGREGVERWLAWVLALSRDTDLLITPDGLRVSQHVAAGQALMTVDWSHEIARYEQLWGEQLGVAPLPTLSDTNTPPAPYVVTEVAALNARVSVEEQRAALSFVRFMLGVEAQRLIWQAGRVPTLEVPSAELDGWPRQQALAAFQEQARQGIPALNSSEAATVERVLRQMQRDVLRGLAQPDDAVTQAGAALSILVTVDKD